MSNRATIKRFLSIVKSDDLIELRCDQKEGEKTRRYHGYFSDRKALIQAAMSFAGNVYFTVNRLDPAIPATNKLIRCKPGACTGRLRHDG